MRKDNDRLYHLQVFRLGNGKYPEGKTIEQRIDKEGVETIDHIDLKGKKTKIK